MQDPAMTYGAKLQVVTEMVMPIAANSVRTFF
jgi:hypothetical protein